MIALTLALALSQAPTQGCITVGSARTCGFGCLDNGSQGACARTPAGVCGKNASSVTCFDPPLWLQGAYGDRLPKPSCITEGVVACGYDCKRASGRGACAQTPKGICTIAYDQVTCFDPPPEVYGALGSDVPAPACVARESIVACGYGCASAAGKTACAKTPFGTCADDGARPVCFDPPKAVICASGKSTPKPKCVPSGNGQLVCGYNCATASGVVACAQTPGGTCDTSGPGSPQCFDPPVRGGSASCLEAASGSPSR